MCITKYKTRQQVKKNCSINPRKFKIVYTFPQKTPPPMENTAVLTLSDGTIFYGESIGASGSFEGELVFNTSSTGYQEVLTDPSYLGQIILFTTPHVGNVGVNEEDMESDGIWAGGVIVRYCSTHQSNFRSQGDLKSFLKKQGTIGISGIDTRALTHIIREKGPVFARITADSNDQTHPYLKKTSKAPHFVSNPKGIFHVVVLDFGVKRSLLNQLLASGCHLTVVPSSTSCDQILSYCPDGVFLSNGPGDPSFYKESIKTIQELLESKIPLLGICLGHQLLALASGAKTRKMAIGQHGANHPILDLDTKQVSISSQNHDFVVSEKNLPISLKITHRSLFDGTIAGICRTDQPALGFQGHPEGSPGPHDLYSLFKTFIAMMEKSYAQKN